MNGLDFLKALVSQYPLFAQISDGSLLTGASSAYTGVYCGTTPPTILWFGGNIGDALRMIQVVLGC